MSRGRAFTVVEIMVTSAILSLSMVVLSRSFQISLDASRYLFDRLDASLVIHNEMWKFQDVLRRSGTVASLSLQTVQTDGSQLFTCTIIPSSLDSQNGFYAIEGKCSWSRSNKDRTLSRDAYVSKI